MPELFTRYETKTSDWTLVVHRVSTTSVDVWFGTLNPSLKMPDKARVVLMDDEGNSVAVIEVTQSDWKRPFSKLKQRFYAVHTFTGLMPGTRYQLRFDRQLPATAGDFALHWQDVCSAECRTLPQSLPDIGNGPFTLAFGSCFFCHKDEGRAAATYKALYKNGLAEFRPEITFLLGDQVYLDIGLDSLSAIPTEIWERVADDYERNWKALGDILRSGGTWMLPDDHEYWNDYPFYETLIPTLWPLKNAVVRNATTAAAIDGVKNIQRSPDVEIINIGKDLSICLANFRSNRSSSGFTDDASFSKIIEWAEQLQSPGVFVTSQNLLDIPGGAEKNLADFPVQYKALIKALGSTGNDIVSLSGDVHFGRIGRAGIGNKGARLIELVASPLSNLTGLGGIATGVATTKPNTFAPGVELSNVVYDPQYFVKTASADLLGGYPKKRTHEHFMTVGFAKNGQGKVQMTVNAWLVRQIVKGLPKSSFANPFTFVLNAKP